MLNARRAALEALARGDAFDLLVAGGGVTGAAVAYEAARRGLRVALVERGDFASGTSSRSSKLVHGGLRYLREGRLGLVREAVGERQALLRAAPGLVDPVTFVMPDYPGRKPGRRILSAALSLYGALAGVKPYPYLDRDSALAFAPNVDERRLRGAHRYLDATTDDARLVLRLLSEACAAGAAALNYAEASPLVEGDAVRGATVTDRTTAQRFDVRAAAVIAATGVFADEIRAQIGMPPNVRPLRGSHLIFASWRFPLACAVAFAHPSDGRPVFAYPWQGATLVGTTDLDHRGDLACEPSIGAEEVAYLIDAVRAQFPSLDLDARDVVATYAGIRPVVAGKGQGDAPSSLSRDHVVWKERGLVTISGGKLTTFRPMALAALDAAADALPPFDRSPKPVFGPPADTAPRLSGRYGADAARFVAEAMPDELECIATTPFLWAELRWAARHEMVTHLDDLLLRRTRVGLLLPGGAERELSRAGAICRSELGWDDARWNGEAERYRTLWRERYFLPNG